MYKLVSKLIIYRNIGEESILNSLAAVCRDLDSGDYNREELTGRVYDEIHRLLDLATVYGFDDNLWHNYLAFLLAMTDTPFTLVSEKSGANAGSVNVFAENDFAVFKSLFDYDFSDLEEKLGINAFSVITGFKAVKKNTRMYNKNVSEKVRALSKSIETAKDAHDIYTIVTDFYRDNGVGLFGLNKAFRISENPELLLTDPNAQILVPITNTAEISFDDLVGYEEQKRKLIENTEAFLNGRPANNVLLYGEAGTGKSTSVKALLNTYYPQGLRMIEIYKHQFKYLSRILSRIKNRNYKFIIYMDDISFEESELEYKYLKAIIEGGLEVKPDNVLIYATSNRRHLVRESFKDRADADDDDIHRNDTIQEKLSLANRFGISIGYFRPNNEEYYNIVKTLASKCPEITLSEEDLVDEARKWEISHGGRTGRCARQFIDYLSGKTGTDGGNGN